ncbi:MAG: glycosyltransferase family 2 protein [Candidatus Levybacteria bacterium]|nr:glycosyltransferase family 2 protein [Candidatus Levybacteria bacterium]
MFEYYRKRNIRFLEFIIPQKKKILFVDLHKADLNIINKLRKKYPTLKVINTKDVYGLRGKFDYVILYTSSSYVNNKKLFFRQLQKRCHPSTRIVMYQRSHIWQWIGCFIERLRSREKKELHNMSPTNNISADLISNGFEPTRIFRSTLLPFFAFGLGPIINAVATAIPFFDIFKIDRYIVARPMPELFRKTELPQSLTICITVRNERDNIEPIVKSLPIICKSQEILFVEGHSSDGTREEIERIARKYTRKHVRVIGQTGRGQGDAIHVGFKESDPRDVHYFYEAIEKGRFEFVEGSRFLYPIISIPMPFINKLGNIFFAKIFSLFFNTHISDVLGGIKAIRKRDYDTLYAQWGFLNLYDPFGDFELLYGSIRQGLKIGEIPMRYYARIYGKSKTRRIQHGFYLLRMLIKGFYIFRII